MEQLVEAYHNVAASPELREMIRQRERAKHNEASALANAAFKERQKNVRNLYRNKYTIEAIADGLDLSLEEIKKILNRK